MADLKEEIRSKYPDGATGPAIAEVAGLLTEIFGNTDEAKKSNLHSGVAVPYHSLGASYFFKVGSDGKVKADIQTADSGIDCTGFANYALYMLEPTRKSLWKHAYNSISPPGVALDSAAALYDKQRNKILLKNYSPSFPHNVNDWGPGATFPAYNRGNFQPICRRSKVHGRGVVLAYYTPGRRGQKPSACPANLSKADIETKVMCSLNNYSVHFPVCNASYDLTGAIGVTFAGGGNKINYWDHVYVCLNKDCDKIAQSSGSSGVNGTDQTNERKSMSIFIRR